MQRIIFCQDRLPYSSFLVFEELRKKGELCDLTLKIQHSTIVAHRVVLAAGIPYFRSLFEKGADEIEEEVIITADLDPNALESLIDFAYCSKVHITIENARSLLLASDFLQLSSVVEACVEFLSDRLHVLSIFQVRTLAHTINNSELIESCNTFIQQNFEEFSKSEEFLSLSYQCVKDAISKDKLSVSDEETVFEVVINWVKYSLPERQCMLPDLLSEVRMTSFPIHYLIKRVATEELVRSSTACRDLIQDVQSFHLLPENERGFLNLNTTPRMKNKKEIYAICNLTSDGYCVYRCDFANGSWYNLKSDKSNVGHIFSAVACNECIYVFLINTIEAFHIKTLEWETLKATHEGIEGSSILAHGNFIYCFGSFSYSFHEKVRCFDTRRNIWLKTSEMENGRSDVSTTSLEKYIYVTGGRWKWAILNTAERYDPSTEQWCQLSPMLAPRRLHGCASVSGKIYVFGGDVVPKQNYLKSVEMYDPLSNQWSIVSSLETGRRRFSFGVHNKQIFAFGGETATGTTCSAELYDPECDQWKPSFKVPEGFVEAVVM